VQGTGLGAADVLRLALGVATGAEACNASLTANSNDTQLIGLNKTSTDSTQGITQGTTQSRVFSLGTLTALSRSGLAPESAGWTVCWYSSVNQVLRSGIAIGVMVLYGPSHLDAYLDEGQLTDSPVPGRNFTLRLVGFGLAEGDRITIDTLTPGEETPCSTGAQNSRHIVTSALVPSVMAGANGSAAGTMQYINGTGSAAPDPIVTTSQDASTLYLEFGVAHFKTRNASGGFNSLANTSSAVASLFFRRLVPWVAGGFRVCYCFNLGDDCNENRDFVFFAGSFSVEGPLPSAAHLNFTCTRGFDCVIELPSANASASFMTASSARVVTTVCGEAPPLAFGNASGVSNPTNMTVVGGLVSYNFGNISEVQDVFSTYTICWETAGMLPNFTLGELLLHGPSSAADRYCAIGSVCSVTLSGRSFPNSTLHANFGAACTAPDAQGILGLDAFARLDRVVSSGQTGIESAVFILGTISTQVSIDSQTISLCWMPQNCTEMNASTCYPVYVGRLRGVAGLEPFPAISVVTTQSTSVSLKFYASENLDGCFFVGWFIYLQQYASSLAAEEIEIPRNLSEVLSATETLMVHYSNSSLSNVYTGFPANAQISTYLAPGSRPCDPAVTVPNLSPGTWYRFRASVQCSNIQVEMNESSRSQWTQWVKTLTSLQALPPSLPMILEGTQQLNEVTGALTLTLFWEPGDPGECVFVRWELEFRRSGSMWEAVSEFTCDLNVRIPSTSCVSSSGIAAGQNVACATCQQVLECGYTYEFRVTERCQTDETTSEPSFSSSPIETPPCPQVNANLPESVTSLSDADSNLYISWVAGEQVPSSTCQFVAWQVLLRNYGAREAFATDWQVDFSPSCSLSALMSRETPVCSVTGLSGSSYYQIAVRELCSLETASGSLLRHSPFLGSAVVSTPLQYPGAPSMIAVVSTETYNALTLQWTPAVLNDCTFVETEVRWERREGAAAAWYQPVAAEFQGISGPHPRWMQRTKE
jgi:hypothetical protein